MTRAELEALAEKLRELIALRVIGDEAPPAERIQALAARFPGALRELDRTPMPTLESDLAAVEAAVAGAPAPVWAEPTSRYHGWLRVAFRLRAESERTEAGALAWRAVYVPAFPGDPPADRLEIEVLRALLAPPDGRLVRVALALTAAELRLPAADVDAMLFGR